MHANGQIGIITQFDISVKIVVEPGFQEYAKNTAMQTAAVDPFYLSEQVIPTDMIEHEKKILTEQVISGGKPAVIAEKIVVSRLSKFFRDARLVDQVYVKDSDKNVQQYTSSITKELGGEIVIKAFTRLEKGEGLRKKEDNFAGEIASMVG